MTTPNTISQPGTSPARAGEAERFVDISERLLQLSRARDAEANQKSMPGPDEVVTLRSLTVAEVYFGARVDDAVRHLDELEWDATEGSPRQSVRTALLGYHYSTLSFWVDPSRSQVGMRHVRHAVPTGVSSVYVRVYVLGPALMSVVATFALGKSDDRRLDPLLRTDAESELVLRDIGTSIRVPQDVKRERVRATKRSLAGRCLAWMTEVFPGTLNAVTEGPGRPTCAVMSLAEGKPFSDHSLYMAMLGLVNIHEAHRIRAPDFLYYVDQGDGWPTLAFNEGDATQPGGWDAVESSPWMAHELLAPMLVADALHNGLLSFTPRFRDIRDGMIRLDLDNVSNAKIFALNKQLLEASIEMAAAVGDVKTMLDGAGIVWEEMPDWDYLGGREGGRAPERLRSIKRSAITSVVTDLVDQEKGLRDLLIVTAEVKSTETNTSLQMRLRNLTVWLVVLTIALGGLGIATLIVDLSPSTPAPSARSHTSHTHVQSTTTAHPTRATSPTP